MGYSPKYHIGWRSDRRERLEYDVFILERDYAGESKEGYLMGDGIVLTYGKQDDDELVPFKASTATITLLCESENNDYSELYTEDPTRYKVIISECRNEMCLPRWVGYISTGLYSRRWGRTPFAVTIEANDGMEILMNTPYQVTAFERHRDTLTLRALIQRLVDPLEVQAVNMGYVPKLTPTQTADSSDLVGISANAIYEAFDNEVPSHYDLLIAILRHFGLQAFFEGEKLCVRSILSLASLNRPEWTGSLESAWGDTPLSTIQLDDTMSVDADMSFLPPLKSMTVENSDDDVRVLSMLDPHRWTGYTFTTPNGISGAARASRGREGLLLMAEIGVEDSLAYLPMGLLKYAFDGWLTPSTISSITLSCELYDRGIRGREGETVTPTMSVVFALVPESEYSDDIFEFSAGGSIKVPANSYVWDDIINASVGEESKRWVSTGTGWFVADSLFRNYAFRVVMDKQDVSLQQARRLPTKLLKSTQASFELSGNPEAVGERYRLVMLVASAAPSENFYVEMLTPVISVSQSGIDDFEEASGITINSKGSADLSYEDSFDNSYTSRIFSPSIIDTETGEAAYRYVTPAMSSEMSRVLGSKLRSIRAGATIQLDGEVAVARPISINTLWEDGRGYEYYTNYIRLLLKRGVAEVQLRELPPLRTSAIWIPTIPIISPRYTANDSSAIFTTGASSNAVYILRQATRTIELIANVTGTVPLRTGVDAMNVAHISNDDSSDYTLRAYGDGGVLLSEIKSLKTIISTPTLSIVGDSFYDATTRMWVIADNRGQSVAVYIVDKNGVLIDKHVITEPGTICKIVPISGGFVICSSVTSPGGNPFIWTNSYYYDIYGQLQTDEAVGVGDEKILAVNDVYIVTIGLSDNILRIRARVAGRFTMKGSEILSQGDGANISFVDMNCALVLMKNSLGEALIYDGRTGNTIVMSDSTLGTAQRYMLIGEVLYIPDAQGNIYEERIIEGTREYDARETFECTEGVFILGDGELYEVLE